MQTKLRYEIKYWQLLALHSWFTSFLIVRDDKAEEFNLNKHKHRAKNKQNFVYFCFFLNLLLLFLLGPLLCAVYQTQSHPSEEVWCQRDGDWAKLQWHPKGQHGAPHVLLQWVDNTKHQSFLSIYLSSIFCVRPLVCQLGLYESPVGRYSVFSTVIVQLLSFKLNLGWHSSESELLNNV